MRRDFGAPHGPGTNAEFDIDGAFLLPDILNPPASPAAGVKIFSRTLAGRRQLFFRTPEENAAAVARSFATNRVGVWLPSGSGSTAIPGLFGISTLTPLGTPTGRICATTNYFTRLRRVGYVSAAAAASITGVRHPSGQIGIGTGLLGGFYSMYRFGISDAAATTGARMFVGTALAAAPTDVEPSTLLNSIGVGHGAADTNLKLFYGGSAAQPPIDLGVNFPTNTRSTDEYSLTLSSPTNVAGQIGWLVERFNNGGDVAAFSASGVLGPTTAGVVLPTVTNTLAPVTIWRSTGAGALAVGVDIVSIYYEMLG